MTEHEKHTEEKIFEAATEVFEEKGFSATRMQDISQKAGINKSLLHYYYRTKEQLFNAVFEMLAKKLFNRFSPIFEENLSLEEKIKYFLREHITFLQKNPRLPSFILYEINQNPERVERLLDSLDMVSNMQKLMEMHKEELKEYDIEEKNLPQVMTSIVSLSVFPFAAKGILNTIFEKLGYDFNSYIEERKDFAGEFVIKAIRKR
jgi:TetR/AcrR family transcriptional regulator